MPPLLRATDSMNSSSATAVPDRSRGLRSQASLEIDALLAGAAMRGEDAAFMSMLRAGPYSQESGESQESQASQRTERTQMSDHEQGSGSGTDGTGSGRSARQGRGSAAGAPGARGGGYDVGGDNAQGGPSTRSRAKSGHRTSSKSKPHPGHANQKQKRDILAAGPMANSFAFDIPDMSSQPTVPTLLSGPGPNVYGDGHGQPNHFNTHSNSHSPIEFGHPGQSISPDQLRSSNDHYDPHGNTMAYVSMQAAQNGGQMYAADGPMGMGMDGADIGSGSGGAMGQTGQGMGMDFGMSGGHGANLELYRPSSVAASNSEYSAGESEYSYSATDVSSVDHHAASARHGQQGQQSYTMLNQQQQPLAHNFAGIDLGTDDPMSWMTDSPRAQQQQQQYGQGTNNAPGGYAPHQRGSTSASVSSAGAGGNSLSPVGGPVINTDGEGNMGAGAVSNVGPIRGNTGGMSELGGYADETPASRQQRLEHRRQINRKSAQKHRARRKEELDILNRQLAERDARIAKLERELAVERAKLVQLQEFVRVQSYQHTGHTGGRGRGYGLGGDEGGGQGQGQGGQGGQQQDKEDRGKGLERRRSQRHMGKKASLGGTGSGMMLD